jgi:hypothetical protein
LLHSIILAAQLRDYLQISEQQLSEKWAWTNRSPSTNAVSVFAVAETLLAVSLYVVIALRFGTLHLTISACIAPFLLLRTDRSTELGIILAKPSHKRLETIGGWVDKSSPFKVSRI